MSSDVFTHVPDEDRRHVYEDVDGRAYELVTNPPVVHDYDEDGYEYEVAR